MYFVIHVSVIVLLLCLIFKLKERKQSIALRVERKTFVVLQPEIALRSRLLTAINQKELVIKIVLIHVIIYYHFSEIVFIFFIMDCVYYMSLCVLEVHLFCWQMETEKRKLLTHWLLLNQLKLTLKVVDVSDRRKNGCVIYICAFKNAQNFAAVFFSLVFSRIVCFLRRRCENH